MPRVRDVMFTVILLSDEPLVEAGVRSVLAAGAEFDVIRCCKTPAEMIRAAAELHPNVLLCGLRQETEHLLGDIRFSSPRSVVVVFNREISAEFAHHALELGVRGFIKSTTTTEELMECLRTTVRGELWIEKALSMALLDTRPVNLSKRQTQLVTLLAQGLKNKEIAAALGISQATVKAYLTVLFEKVGARDRFEVALFGLKNLRNARPIGGDQDFRMKGPSRSAASSRPAGRTV